MASHNLVAPRRSAQPASGRAGHVPGVYTADPVKIMTAVAAASILLLAGCNGAESAAPPAAAPSASAGAVPAPSAAGPSGAPADSECRLPVAFDVAEGWTTKAIDVHRIDDELLAGMFRTGPFDQICSVNGKEAGVNGFVRVYLSDVGAGNPRDNLKVFVHADTIGVRGTVDYEVRDAEYRDLTVGGAPAAEVTWDRHSTAKKSKTRYSAFSLDTPAGAVVVVLVPFRIGDYADVRPAYELARKTLTVLP